MPYAAPQAKSSRERGGRPAGALAGPPAAARENAPQPTPHQARRARHLGIGADNDVNGWAMNKKLSFLAAAVLVLTTSAAHAQWNPQALGEQDTLEFRSDCPDEGEHWSPVWLVLLDGDLYIRLGKRAAERFDCSRDNPYVGIRIAGQEFPRVHLVDTPEMVAATDEAMADKYWTDIFISPFAKHLYNMRLVVEAEATTPEEQE